MCHIIVTASLRDFPAGTLGEFGMEAQHPDEFILSLLDLSQSLVVSAARDHRENLKNPPKTIKQYLGALEAQGLMQNRIRASGLHVTVVIG